MVEHLIGSFNLVTFDYTGYGYSDKDKCTLGPKETYDLEAVVNHVKREFGFKRIYIWGRSMGAVTAVLLASRSNSLICQGLILDSPFSSTKEMLCNIMEKVPNFLLHLLFMPLGSKLHRETGYDMLATNLTDQVQGLVIPALFAVAEQDRLAGVENVQGLYMKYGLTSQPQVHKQMIMFPGEHSSSREDPFLGQARSFLETLEEAYQLGENIHSPMMGHFTAHKKLKQIHGLNSPRRLKKSERCIEVAGVEGKEEDLSKSMLEFYTSDGVNRDIGSPPKVRATPENISKLSSPRGDHQGLLKVPRRIPKSEEGDQSNSKLASLPNRFQSIDDQFR